MLTAALILDPDALRAWRRNAVPAGAPLAVLTGAFDLLHPGNLITLQRAAALGPACVLIESDALATARTGRPPQAPAARRAEFVAALRGAAAACVLDQPPDAAWLDGLRPFVWVGADAGPAIHPLDWPVREAADLRVGLPLLPHCGALDIRAALQAGRTPIPVPADAFPEPVTPARDTPRPRVTVNGCFDILHIGHLRFLAAARAMGASLTVLANSDASVRRYKGPTRPVFPQAFRAAALLALRAVDDVRLFDADTPLDLLAALRPDVHAKGGSFEPERVAEERALLAQWGGRLATTPLVDGFSTSGFIRKARA